MKPEYPEKTPGDELQKMPPTTARRFKSQARLEPVQWHWWQARKADMLIVTLRVGLRSMWFHGVMVSTLDSESSDPSSNLGGTC